MGSGASSQSMASISSLPQRLNKDLCLSYGISENVFETQCDSSKTLSKDFVIKYLKITDVFLSHDWGTDELDRPNHDRVAKINEALKSRNFITWFDSGMLLISNYITKQ